MPIPDQAKAAAEIARLKDHLTYLANQSRWDAELTAAMDRCRAQLAAAEMQHIPTVRARLARHIERHAQYVQLGDSYGIWEHETGAAKCRAALAAMGAVQVEAA